MPTSRNDVRVQCPFYLYDERVGSTFRIVCEGFGDAVNLANTYRSKEAFVTQLDTFCCEHYDRCEVYRAQMERYGGSDED